MKTKENITNLKPNLTRNHDNKELVKRYLVISSTLDNVIDCRLYMGRSSNASVVYCDLWIQGNQVYGSGNGSAGGYGYDKQHSATMQAIRNAGILLTNDTGGYANVTLETVLLSIADALDSTLTYKVFR